MRTLQIGDDWLEECENGLSRYYFELLRHLPATGTTAHGLVVGGDRARISTNGQVVAFGRPEDPMPRRLLAARRAALDLLDHGKIDLIASHFALYAMPIADRLRSTPTVMHFHGPWSAESDFEGAASHRSSLKAAMERGVYVRARRLIVLSRSFHQELTTRFRVDEDCIRIVPGGVDTERFNTDLTRAEARERLRWPTDRPILLTVRRLVRRMGLENLIDATSTLIQKQPDLLVLMGGKGPIANELQRRITERGLDQHVRLLGRVDDADLPAAFRAADMSVVPTQALEGFGLITLESLASGTPVYVTPVGGLPETVDPFAPECVFGDTSAAEIGRVLGEALAGERHVPSEAACRAYAAENFAWPRIAEKIRKVYDEAMG